MRVAFPFRFFAAALSACGALMPLRAAEPAAPAPAAARFALPATDDGLPGAGPLRRYDWFQRLWTERRSGWAARLEQDRGALVWLGDSITQGWGGTLAAAFPGVKMANRGISGDTTRGVLIRLQEDVLALQPKGIVLLIGTNDLEEQATPETATANLKLILAAIRRHDPQLPVLLCNVFPSSEMKKRPKEQIAKLNALYAAAIQSEPQVTLLDTWSLFAGPQGDAKAEEFPDLLHPNVAGYLKWAAALRPALETLGLIPAWPDDFAPEPGFAPLFNGNDLGGWAYEKSPLAAGQRATADGRFVARHGRLIATAHRGPRKIVRLETSRSFPRDFELRFEFRAGPAADSGVFVREPQLQIRDFLIAGPYVTLAKFRPLQWNEVTVTVRGGLAQATCNGEVLAEAMPIPATGPLAFEGDRGQVEYRRIRIRELP
jgi:lysophospholipase L1-like esterase